MITGFFDDGYGLGVPTTITISANPKNRKVRFAKPVNVNIIRLDGNYAFPNKGITPYDIAMLKKSNRI